jgi:ubiquinone/menaquinone biosynthesis C-methylase UbiE
MTFHHPSWKPAALLLVTLLVPSFAYAQRSSSRSELSADKIFSAIGIVEGGTVCEIGAGDGELTIAAARIVGPAGRVFSSELGENRLTALREQVAKSNLAQITVVAGDDRRTNFPDAACDGVLLRDVYHHFTEPAAMNASIALALKPGGRVAIVDFTPPGEEASCPADRDKDGMHGVKAESVTREMKEAGLEPVASAESGQRWFMVVLAKPKLSSWCDFVRSTARAESGSRAFP